MLHPVGKLSQHSIRNITRALGHEIHPHTPGANQLHRLFDFLQQHLRHISEQRVRLIEEKYQARLVQVAGFRQTFEQLRQQPQKESGVQRRILHQFHRVQHVNHAPALGISADPILNIQSRLSEEQVAALLLQRQQCPQDGRHRLRRNVSVGHHVFRAVLAHVVQHDSQILQVGQQKALVIGDAEHDVKDAFLHICQTQNPAEKLRPHLADGDPDGVTALLIDIPEGGRIFPVSKSLPKAETVDALLHILRALPRCTDARHISFYIAHEHRHARIGKGFRHHLHGDRLAGTAGAGNQPVAVAHFQHHFHPLVPRQAHIYSSILVHNVILRLSSMLLFIIIRAPSNRRNRKRAAPRMESPLVVFAVFYAFL